MPLDPAAPGEGPFPLWSITITKTLADTGEDIDWEIVSGTPTLLEVVGAVEWVKMQVQRQIMAWEDQAKNGE